MIGPSREQISPEKRRQAFLKLAYQKGFDVGFYEKEDYPCYQGDEEARMRYRIGVVKGRHQRKRASQV